MHTELAILGGGPGGYAAAFLAADLGVETTIIERRAHLGGVCLIEGCIPTKELLYVARGIGLCGELKRWGVTVGEPRIDLDAMRKQKNETIATLARGLDGIARRRRIRVLRAKGTLESSTAMRLEGSGGEALEDDRLEFERLILATGSRAVVPRPLRTDSDRVMTSTEAQQLPEIPGRLLVIGGSYIGLETGTVYARLGSQVTVVEMLDRLLAIVDPDLVDALHDPLRALFKAVHLRTEITGLRTTGAGVEATFLLPDGERTETYDRVLVAVGRRPNSDGIGLENTDVELDDQGNVRVDARRRTADEHIWAVGDVAGEPQLAHKAFHEGAVAAEDIAGQPAAFQPRCIPAVVFTDPEIAWAGLTEQDAAAVGARVEVARFPWSASGRAHSMGRTEGFTKLLFDPDSDRLLGAGVIGPEAGELIAECALAIEMGATARDLAETIHAHPTLAETIAGAAEVHLGHPRELPPKRKQE